MHGVEHTVRAGGDVCIAVAVIERRAVERANIVVRAVFLAAAVQTVDGQVLLVRQQIIEVLTMLPVLLARKRAYCPTDICGYASVLRLGVERIG